MASAVETFGNSNFILAKESFRQRKPVRAIRPIQLEKKVTELHPLTLPLSRKLQ
jgi:hypothetical protein